MDAFELPVALHSRIIQDRHHAIPLCIALTNAHLDGWVDHRFTNYALFASSSKYKIRPVSAGIFKPFEIDYTDMAFIYDEVINEGGIPWSLSPDTAVFVDFILKAIKSGTYVMVRLDLFYLRGSYCYGQEHFTSEVLLNGIDLARKVVIGVDLAKHLSRREWTFAEIEAAYGAICSAMSTGAMTAPSLGRGQAIITLCTPRDTNYPYSFSPRQYLADLADFCESRADPRILYLGTTGRVGGYAEVTAGVRVVELAADYVAQMTRLVGEPDDDVVDYRHFQLFWEHGRNVYEVLERRFVPLARTARTQDLMNGLKVCVDEMYRVRAAAFSMSFLGQQLNDFDTMWMSRGLRKYGQDLRQSLTDVIGYFESDLTAIQQSANSDMA